MYVLVLLCYNVRKNCRPIFDIHKRFFFLKLDFSPKKNEINLSNFSTNPTICICDINTHLRVVHIRSPTYTSDDPFLEETLFPHRANRPHSTTIKGDELEGVGALRL